MEELAFTLADGKEYVKTAIAKGMDVTSSPAPVVLLGHRHELLPGVAKMRAAPAVVPHHEGSTPRTPRA